MSSDLDGIRFTAGRATTLAMELLPAPDLR